MRHTTVALLMLALATSDPVGLATAAGVPTPAPARDVLVTGAKTAASHEALASRYD